MGICWGFDRGSARWAFAGGLIEVALDGHLLGGVDRGSARWAYSGGR